MADTTDDNATSVADAQGADDNATSVADAQGADDNATSVADAQGADDVIDPTTVDPTTQPTDVIEEAPVVVEETPAEPMEEVPATPVEEPVETPEAATATEPVGDAEATLGEIDAQGRQTYNVKCSNCGMDTNVPFQPTAGRPVYCRDCLMKTRESRNG